MKNLGVFSSKLFFFIDTSVEETRESICRPIGLALSIIDPKMIPGELLDLPDLTRAQALRIYELTEVVMIG